MGSRCGGLCAGVRAWEAQRDVICPWCPPVLCPPHMPAVFLGCLYLGTNIMDFVPQGGQRGVPEAGGRQGTR